MSVLGDEWQPVRPHKELRSQIVLYENRLSLIGGLQANDPQQMTEFRMGRLRLRWQPCPNLNTATESAAVVVPESKLELKFQLNQSPQPTLRRAPAQTLRV